jgi:hypothetical protein
VEVRSVSALSDLQARQLVDALVEAIDLGRSEEVDRVVAAMAPLGLDGPLTEELRLSGTWSETPLFDPTPYNVEVAF